MPRFVVRSKADRLKAVPESQRITVGHREVVLACGCKTRKPPAATKPGGIHLHFCAVHPGLQKERR